MLRIADVKFVIICFILVLYDDVTTVVEQIKKTAVLRPLILLNMTVLGFPRLILLIGHISVGGP